MAVVYILYSVQAKRFYVGSCNNLEERMEQHRLKTFPSSYTAKNSDWEIFYTINNLEYKQARKIELHIKRMKSKIYIENLLIYPSMTENLKRKYLMKNN